MNKFKKIVSLVMVCIFVLGVTTQAFAGSKAQQKGKHNNRVQIKFEFKDMEQAQWAAEYVNKMKAKRIFTGYPDGTFRPNQPVTRVEAIVMAVRLMELESEAKDEANLEKVLNFRDAKLIEAKYPWAKGYLVVALENGLFDASEAVIQPNKPASRVWVSSLLVRALGLQSEALEQMTVLPDVVDANAIPAGAVGYVNVAIDQGLITGYPDGTFKPNKPITRAEIATLLDRTNDELLDNEGAIVVGGTILDIEFEAEDVDDSVYGESGTITIKSFSGETLDYNISSDLLVQYQDNFITADQLKIDDVVKLVVKDEEVIEATLFDEDIVEQPNCAIMEMRVKAKFANKNEFRLEFKNKNGRVKGSLDKKVNGKKAKINANEINKFTKDLSLSPDMSQDEIQQAVLAAIACQNQELQQLQIRIKFANGEKVEFKYCLEGLDEEEDDDEEEDEDEDEDEDDEEESDEEESDEEDEV